MKIRMILINAALVASMLLAAGVASAQTVSLSSASISTATLTAGAQAAAASLVVQVQTGVDIGSIASQVGTTTTTPSSTNWRDGSRTR